jgi:membrane protease subunit HflC
MKIFALLLIPIVILAAILGPQFLFVVDETQVAIVTRFGDPQRSIRTPGLNLKTPFVDTVTYFEKRLLLFDASADSLLTEDKRRLVIDVYARGRIVDPLLFFERVRDETRARNRAIEIIASELRREIALDLQAEIIATSREAIMLRVRDAISPKLAELGIQIVDVRIKRADFPEEIADSIHQRMSAERKRLADRERAQGAERDAEIRAETDKEAAIILAEADKTANLTRGEGEAEAITIFAGALQQDPEFYTFQRSLEAYKKFLTQNTTVVLPANSDLFRFLQSPTGTNGKTDGTSSE